MNQQPEKQPWWRMSLTKSRFRWQEPKAYLRLKDECDRPKLRRAQPWLLCGLFAFFMLQWAMAKANPGKHPPPLKEVTLILLAGSALLAYGVPWLIGKCESEIGINDRLIWRSRGNSVRRWEFRHLVAYRWIEMKEWGLLLLERKAGKRGILSVPPEVSRLELEAFLQERGLRKEPDGHWSNFEELSFLRNAVG